MSHDQFPAYRLITLIMRQISSPIATRITAYAKGHPRFSRAVCVRTCELYRRAEWRARTVALRAAGRRDAWQLRAPPPLALTEAQQTGADILSEVVLFMFGAMIVTFEVNRQANLKYQAKQQEREAWMALIQLLKEIEAELADQELRLGRLRTLVQELQSDGVTGGEGLPEGPGINIGEDLAEGIASATEGILGGAKALASIFFWLHQSDSMPKSPLPAPPTSPTPRTPPSPPAASASPAPPESPAPPTPPPAPERPRECTPVPDWCKDK